MRRRLLPLLLLIVAAAPVFIGLRIATKPVTTARIAAFAKRHRLDLTPADQPYVAGYLTHIRRWRTAGALGGYLTGLAWALPQERITLYVVPVLAGWFAGAVVAEFRFRSRPGDGPDAPVPGWLTRVPPAVAAATAGVTALVLAFGRAGDQSWRVLACGAGALACAAGVAAANRHVRNRATATAAGHAVAAHAVGAVTAAGSALAIICLAYELVVVRDRFFDAAATAVGGTALLWAVGAVAIGWLVASATWQGGAAGPAPGRAVVLVVATLLAVSAGWAGYARWRDHPPYPATAVHATATLRFTDQRDFEQDARALGLTGFNGMVDQPGHRQFIGRIDHTTPAGKAAGSTYHVIVIGKPLNRVAPHLYGADGGGWDARLSDLARRYPWLSATAPTVSAAGYSDDGWSVSQAADEPGPMTFVGSLPDTAARSLSDLMVVLVLTGPDGQVYWATRVSG